VYGVEPDIMTLAKGLGSGVPIGAIMAKERVSVFAPGEHGSTFGGNPLVCAAALATLRYIIANDVPAKVEALGRHLTAQLETLKREFSFITEIRGRGLLLALQFDRDIAEGVTLACLDRGLLVNAVKPDALRFIPPLIITEAQIDDALRTLREVLRRWQEVKK